MLICIESNSALNYFQFIFIKSGTKMPLLATLCITEKLETAVNSSKLLGYRMGFRFNT